MASLGAPTVVAFLAFVLVLFPLPWLLHSKNIATLSLVFWLAQANFFQIINTYVWSDNVIVRLERYCNIFTLFQDANVFALVAACMCTLRNLERAASPRVADTGAADLRRRKRFDLLMCAVLPFVYSLAQYIVAPNQFNIYEGIGCHSTSYVTWPAILIWYLPPLYLGVTTLTYAVLTFQWLLLHRGTLRSVLTSTSTPASSSGTGSISPIHFVRLLSLSVICSFFAVAASLFQLFESFPVLAPWISWDNVHTGFSEIGQFPSALMGPSDITTLWVFWGIFPAAGFLFFLLFGLTGEVVGDCKRAGQWVLRGSWWLRGSKGANSPGGSGSGQEWAPPVPPKKSAQDRYAAGDDLDFDEGPDADFDVEGFEHGVGAGLDDDDASTVYGGQDRQKTSHSATPSIASSQQSFALTPAYEHMTFATQ